jgi:outer membrane protein assembly factor BamD (BamD/ComL family)
MWKHLLCVILAFWFIYACSEKKSETEYYQTASDLYSDEAWEEAVGAYSKLLETYPNGEHTSNALFMIGFIHANYTKKFEEAEKYYNEFIEKYPDDGMVSSAKYELENLGKDINELPIFKDLQEEEKKNAEE